ncbi:hypothetical protein AVEN_70734-1 [Araneus ventricosus]|uniref:Uncharacterized protein n=1 Tax=Araneus ventricosus TaxID=182803 RepID=A0A4Y2KIY8_ARAVE|nr:hypothetical protein AVEN_70734-1 [Araneus ventricosus]
MGLEVKDYIYEFEEDHSQELITETTAESLRAWMVFQQEVVEESFSEEEAEVTAKQQSYGAIREMLKERETVALYIEKWIPTPNLPTQRAWGQKESAGRGDPQARRRHSAPRPHGQDLLSQLS